MEITCSCGFGDHLSILRIVDNQDLGDDNEEERAVCVEGTAVDYVGVGGLWLGLN